MIGYSNNEREKEKNRKKIEANLLNWKGILDFTG